MPETRLGRRIERHAVVVPAAGIYPEVPTREMGPGQPICAARRAFVCAVQRGSI